MHTLEINEMKALIYHQPLPKKKQRVTQRAELPGKPKIYTKEEIFLYQVRQLVKKFKQLGEFNG